MGNSAVQSTVLNDCIKQLFEMQSELRCGDCWLALVGARLANSVESMKHNFPIARRLLAFAGRARAAWLLRHTHPWNYWLHLVGIPMAFTSLGWLVWGDYTLAAFTFVGGYLLQWIGHLIEGNDVGELIPIKRALGLRVVAIANTRPIAASDASTVAQTTTAQETV